MTIKFFEPLAHAKDYPTPKIKGLASLRPAFLNLTTHPFNKNIVKNGLFTQNARNGLALIGKQLQLNNKQTILLPAYHCPALVEPFIWLGINIRFYHLNKDLSVNLDDFKDKIDESTTVCVIVRFFGFTTNLQETVKLAKSNKLTIIEDWAHCFFGQLKNLPVEDTGDFSVASCNKFFPTYDGGVVWGLEHPQQQMVNFSWKEEISSFLKSFNTVWKLITFFKKAIVKTTQAEQQQQSENTQNSILFRYFSPSTLNHACLRLTKWVVNHSKYKTIIEQRQSNYRFLLEHLSDTRIGKPLYLHLEDDTVPYVFPFYLYDSAHFNDLKQAGISLFRWEELAKSDCSVSRDYREHLIQLPCHQDLSKKHLSNIVAIIKNLEA